MKRILSFILFFTALLVMTQTTFADSMESTRVIRADKDRQDLIVQRQNGELWLIQHNPLCSSMSTEFQVMLVMSNNKITQLKVAANEICKVYNAVRYSGEAKLTARIMSENSLTTEHEAEIIWLNNKYRIDYDKSCSPAIRDYVGQNVYLSLPKGDLKGGQLVLPGNRGQCTLKNVTDLGLIPESEKAPIPDALQRLEYQAQNNQVYFYWDHPKTEENPLYLISYSRFPINPALYQWNTMPNLRVTKANTYTVTQLANGLKYYFYIAALNKDNGVGPWSLIEASPVSLGGFKNNPDPEPFEVRLQDKANHFLLTWPAKEAARKYRISLFVNGKPEYSKSVPATTTEIQVPKKPEYLGKGLRFTVRTVTQKPYQASLFDGVYWEYKNSK